MRIGALLLAACTLLFGTCSTSFGSSTADEKPVVGFQPEVAVKLPTRLDWEFCVRGLPPEQVRLPAGYDSGQQRYQLYVPPAYEATRTWPLIVFLSPGDDPLGWRHWEGACERKGLLFCAAYGAGNSCPPGKRTRIVLDVLDDLRRRSRIDPDQTYLAGFGGGGELACTIAFALPEYFGGVLAIGGASSLPRLASVRQRIRERLSVALITGERDFQRGELADYLLSYFTDLGVRTRCEVRPGRGHEMPPQASLEGACDWLAADLPRRQAEARERPELAASAQEVPTNQQLASRMLKAAEAEALRPLGLPRSAALLEEIAERWPRTDAAGEARTRLQRLRDDPVQQGLLAAERGAEERRELAAGGKALEKRGDLRAALAAWQELAGRHAMTREGRAAAEQVQRLRQRLEALPWLGLAVEGESVVVQTVTPDGPASRAGIKPGDRLEQLGDRILMLLPDLRQALAACKAGDRVRLKLRRGDNLINVEIELGRLP
jgi:hypothetical protein